MLGELELAWRMLANEFIAVTGTNGKTTTVELIGHIHREAGLPVAVAGNVGTAVSSLVGSVAPEATIVCEASSFQLEDTLAFAPEAAVLLNIAPDHLDRHGTLRGLPQAKLLVFARQGNDDVAVAPLDLEVEDLGGCARRVLLRRGAGRRAVRAGRASCGGRSARCSARQRAAPARRAQRPERDGRGGGVPGAGRRRGRGARRAALLRRRSPPPRGGRALATACCT